MDLIDSLKVLAKRIETSKDQMLNEESTKNSCVLPFLQLLNYDVFNVNEVMPEYSADYGTKKGERIDYAIFEEGKPIIFIECKSFGTCLDDVHASQLYRYYSVSPETRIGIVTNGHDYRFYADLDTPNQMDRKPFFELDIFSVTDKEVREIKKFIKGEFDVEKVLSVASELKFVRGVLSYLSKQYESPDDDFARLMSKEAYAGQRISANKLAQFKPLVQSAFRQFVSAKVNDRLQSALSDEEKSGIKEAEDVEGIAEEAVSEIETTELERIGFRIIMSICSEKISNLDSIVAKDNKSYFGVFYEGNTRKPIVRLHFNNEDNLQLNLFSFEESGRNDRIVKIDSVNEIYKYKNNIQDNLMQYVGD